MFDKYIEKHGRRIYGLCMHLCASEQEAQDLYQETWLKAFSYYDRFDRTREFEPWITKICVNTYRSLLRKKKLTQVLFRDDQEMTYEEEDHSELHLAISKLPEKLRLTLILFYFRDMDISHTAKALGIPEGTVKSRLSKGRKMLKEVLTDEEHL